VRFDVDLSDLRTWRRAGCVVVLRMLEKHGLKKEVDAVPREGNRDPLRQVHLKHVWPRSMKLYINGQSAFVVEVPKHLKKRRDEPFDMTHLLRSGPNQVEIYLDSAPGPPNSGAGLFVAGLILCERVSPSQLAKLAVPLSEGDCKARVIRLLTTKPSGCAVDVVTDPQIRLNCTIAFQRITTPARGRHCEHLHVS
jgi:hypothetical protein